MDASNRLPAYRNSLAGNLLAAREAVMEPLRPVLRTVGLTEQQWRVLRVLTDEGPTDPSRLAEEGLLYAPSVARILHDLAARKLIVRKADPQDGRRKVIAITAQGRSLVEQTASQVAMILEHVTRLFGRKRLLALQAELGELVRTMGEIAPSSD